MMEKKFEANLIVDYKSGKFSVFKRKVKNLKASEIPIKVELTIIVPEKPDLIIKGNIKLSGEKVKEMVIEEL